MNVTTLHEYLTPEYTLTAMLAGTNSVAVVPEHGAAEPLPKAILPIAVRLLGRIMLVRLRQYSKAILPIAVTAVGMLTLLRP